MTTQANPALLTFYHVTAIKDWTHVNIVEYYRAKLENKEYRNVMDCIKKDLIKVAKNSEFGKTRREKTETILNNWECKLGLLVYGNELFNGDELLVRRLAQAGLLNWISSRENSKDYNSISVNIKNLQVEQFATRDSQVINNHIKHWRDVNNGREVTTPSKKIKTTSSERNVEDSAEGISTEASSIACEGDNNPFLAQTGEDLTKYKFILSWSHAIDNVTINNVSENDWLTQDRYNISIDFRKFQAESIKKLKINLTLSYAKEIDTIFSSKITNPKELPTVADLVIIEYSRLLNDKQSLNTKWRNNWAKGNTLLIDEDKDIFDCMHYDENKKLDEDTFIHRYCYQILEEVFNKTELSLVWVNGESESSKEKRLLDGHNHGRKPDFRVLLKIDDDDTEREFIFGEIKPPHCPNTINKSIIKLAEFMKGSLDLIIHIYEIGTTNMYYDCRSIA
ncbi:hypothetical protein Glove_193g12 [Diversispora epigaea]|uniref:Uncharacterized protein n=1 Tax=Diversispora epigaea TaxID=1348612 RepID=A0A397ILI3_9GLOM|nr:hypothetical protein Glove_193g12 [Diversispora epigaea]